MSGIVRRAVCGGGLSTPKQLADGQMNLLRLTTVKVANLPSVLSAKWTSHNITVHVFQAILESICAGTSSFVEVSAHKLSRQHTSALLVLLLVNKPVFKHVNGELWLYIAADLLLQCGFKLNNNIYKMVQCIPSFSPSTYYNIRGSSGNSR